MVANHCLHVFSFYMIYPIDYPLTHAAPGHYALWENGVHHRDISPTNLVVYRTSGGRWIGVLNDFDLSSTRDTPSGQERTGTVPFMALELLTKKAIHGQVKHMYQHDAESFIWVLTWVCICYEDGVYIGKGIICTSRRFGSVVRSRRSEKSPGTRNQLIIMNTELSATVSTTAAAVCCPILARYINALQAPSRRHPQSTMRPTRTIAEECFAPMYIWE
jgi:serine/threonine protein kinase